MRYLLLFLLFPTILFAEDGKLSTSESVATTQITVIIPPRAEVQKDESVKTNIENAEIEREGNLLIIFPSSK